MKAQTITMLMFLLFILPLSVAGAENAKVLLIFDSSGSMWGQIDGKAKITIAKEALSGIIEMMPKNIDTGLMAYGHRRKGDCQDIELLIPPGPLDTPAMKARIVEISPKGKTPLSASLQIAARTLRSTEEAASIILITDGLETCDSDPCQVAADLAMSGVDFTVHVIGFDLSKADQDRVRCIADKTGGLFVAADNAASLKTALTSTVKKVEEPPPPLVEDPGTATLEAPEQAVMGETFEVKWQGPDSRGDYVCLTTPDPKDSHCLDHSYTEQGNPIKLSAKCDAGPYQLRYIHSHSGKVLGQRDITVIPAQVELEVPAEAVAATPITVGWKGPGYQTDYIAISNSLPQDHGYISYTYTREGSPLKVQAPSAPGIYEIRYVLGAGDMVLARKNITIQQVTADIQSPNAAAAASSFQVQWQGPGNSNDYISVARPDDEDGYDNYSYTKSGNPVKLTAPSTPGNYEVRYVLGQDSVILARRAIEVQEVAALVQGPSEASAASRFKVQWQGPNSKGDYISIAEPDQKGGSYLNYSYTRSANPATLTAPSSPGKYEVRYILGKDNVILARQEINITAVTAQVQPPAQANAAEKFAVPWQGPSNNGDYICISKAEDAGGKYFNYAYTKSGNPVRLTAPSNPGTYEVRYIMAQGNVILARQSIEIQAVTAEVKPPANASSASKFNVTWQGPNNDGDYIAIAQPEKSGADYLNYAYTRSGNPLNLTAPSEPGTYEVRYIMAQDNVILARQSIEIQGITAQIQAPATAPMGSVIAVQWQGPNNDGDFISLARPEDDGGGYFSYQYTNQGNPINLQLPTSPGKFEVRYVLRLDNKILSKQLITIEMVNATLEGPASAGPTTQIAITWQGPNGPNDYIAIALPEEEGGSYLSYEYTASGNPVKINTPEQPGRYETRYISGDTNEILAKTALTIE